MDINRVQKIILLYFGIGKMIYGCQWDRSVCAHYLNSLANRVSL